MHRNTYCMRPSAGPSASATTYEIQLTLHLSLNSHPVHPALVHFPLAFNTLSFGLDILYGLTTVFIKPAFLTSRFSAPETLLDITRLSYFLLCTGLITAVPTIMSGNKQLVGLIKKNGGLYEKDAQGNAKDTMVPRIKVAIAHALMNDTVFILALISWWLRRSTEDKVNLGNVPGLLNIALSTIALPILLAAGASGAHLVYNHGVGLNLGRKKED